MEIRRDKYLDLLIHSCGNGLIKVITGMRRCGKSYHTSLLGIYGGCVRVGTCYSL